MLKINRRPISGRSWTARVWSLQRNENEGERAALRRIESNTALQPYFPKLVGFGRINEHDAIVVTRAHVDGRIVSLPDYARAGGSGPRVRRELGELCALMCRDHIVCNDIAARNIAMHGEPNSPTPVVIDGFGDHHPIPYPTWSKRLNAAKLRRRFMRINARLDDLEKTAPARQFPGEPDGLRI